MEREYDVEITTQAQEQMREIGAYIKNTLGMPEAAKKTLKKLEKGISLLSFMPEMAPLLDEEPWHSKGVRKLLLGHYIVYYFTMPKARKLRVIAVVYVRRNQQEQLERTT